MNFKSILAQIRNLFKKKSHNSKWVFNDVEPDEEDKIWLESDLS